MWPKKKDKRTIFGKSDPGSTQSAKTIYHRGKVKKPNRLIHKAKCKQDAIRGYPIGSCMNLNLFGTVCKFESVVGLLIITGSRCNCAYQLQANPITLTVVIMMQRNKWGKSWNHYFQSLHTTLWPRVEITWDLFVLVKAYKKTPIVATRSQDYQNRKIRQASRDRRCTEMRPRPLKDPCKSRVSLESR
jgi:hypothetical protein